MKSVRFPSFLEWIRYAILNAIVTKREDFARIEVKSQNSLPFKFFHQRRAVSAFQLLRCSAALPWDCESYEVFWFIDWPNSMTRIQYIFLILLYVYRNCSIGHCVFIHLNGKLLFKLKRRNFWFDYWEESFLVCLKLIQMLM